MGVPVCGSCFYTPLLQVRIQTPGEMLPVSPTPESEPAEQHELLKPDSPTEMSEWV